MLGPEMKSTGEVMGLDTDFGRAFAKAQLALAAYCQSGYRLRFGKDGDKEAILEPIKDLAGMGFEVVATVGPQLPGRS